MVASEVLTTESLIWNSMEKKCKNPRTRCSRGNRLLSRGWGLAAAAAGGGALNEVNRLETNKRRSSLDAPDLLFWVRNFSYKQQIIGNLLAEIIQLRCGPKMD